MFIRRVSFCLCLAVLAFVFIGVIAGSRLSSQGTPPAETVVAGRNVKMVSGMQLPGGAPYLQRQDEPSSAGSIEGDFDWADVPAATAYHLYVLGPEATIPLVDQSAIASLTFNYSSPDAFVEDINPTGWIGMVRAFVNNAWTGWSEVRSFDVGPATDCLMLSPPIIGIRQGETDIPNGGSYNFGNQIVGSNMDIIFTIENHGTADLTLSGTPIVSITGINANQFSVQQQAVSPVSQSQSTNFIIRFHPTSTGSKRALLSIANNSSNQNPFKIFLLGDGAPIGGLIAYYPFNGSAKDQSGNGNNGAIKGGATFTADKFGNRNGAINFDGIDDYVEIPDSANFNFSYPVTIVAWIYLNDNSKGGIVEQWGYGGAAGDAFTLYMKGTKLSTYLPRPSLAHYELQGNSSLATGQWYQVSMVSTGSLVTLYINGNEDKSETVTVKQVDSAQTVKIGLEDRFFGKVNYFNGIINEVRVYNRALSASEIQALYAASGETYKLVAKWGSHGSGDGQFRQALKIAVDSTGSVYVADPGNARIQKFTSNGDFVTKWGSLGSGDGQFNAPCGITVDDSGNVYVADLGNNRIQKFTSTGDFVTKWGSNGSNDGQFNSPRGITVDDSGNVYVADQGNDRIQKFTSNGDFVTKWGSLGNGDGQFNDPNGIAVDSSGNVYVADLGNNRIQKFTSNGDFVAKWDSLGSGDGQFGYPEDIADDSSGNIYVADTSRHRMLKFTSGGTFAAKWGTQGSGDGQFYYPQGIAVDSSGNVYVADTWNNRIQKFRIR